MNYHLIHDKIIHRGLSRIPTSNIKYEKHHIIPRCEGGAPQGTITYLTVKEHRIVHKIRYLIYGNIGNLFAYYLMKNGRKFRTKEYYKIRSSYAHQKFKERDLDAYRKR